MEAKRAKKILNGDPWEGDLVDVILYAQEREKRKAWSMLQNRCLEQKLPTEDMLMAIEDVAYSDKVLKIYKIKARNLLKIFGRCILK